MGLPHVLVRFYTNPDGRDTRRTALIVIGLLSAFYQLPTLFGVVRAPLPARTCCSTGSTDATVLLLPERMLAGPAGSAARRAGHRRRVRRVPVDRVRPDRVGRRRAVPGRARAPGSAHRRERIRRVPAQRRRRDRRALPAEPGRRAAQPGGHGRARVRRSPPARSARCSCSASGGAGSPTSGPWPGSSPVGCSPATAVLVTMLLSPRGGWPGALLAQPAAWIVPLTFAVMVTGSLLHADRASRADVGRVLIRLHAPESMAADLPSLRPVGALSDAARRRTRCR